MTPARKAVAAGVLVVVLFAAVVVQLTVVNRLPLPGGAVPDLVLLLVTAIAVVTTPARAAVTGFAAGLAVDVAPPAAHDAGTYALVFCLAAYAASRVNRAISDRAGERDPMTSFTVMVGAAVAGEAGKAALGMLLSDPEVTTAAVSRVLPGAVLYDLLLSPLAFWLVARVTRGAAPERAPVPELGRGQRPTPAFRLASAGAAPKLRLAGTGARYETPAQARRPPSPRHPRFAGTGKDYRVPSGAGRVPKLRLSGAGAGSAFKTVRSSSGRPTAPPRAGQARKLNFTGDLPARAAVRTARAPGKNWLRSAASPAPGTARRQARTPALGPARGWLKAGMARPAGSPPAASRPRTAGEALAARSAPSGLSALAGP
ncbi:MAG: rod shape-determining protein MreD, partial [Trebonia sp.]